MTLRHMYLRLLAGALSVGALCSCSTISHTAHTADVDTRLYNVTVADMKVSDTKATKTLNWDWLGMTGSVESKKESVASELLKEKDADLLVEPQFIVNKRGLFRGGSVTVTGYPATYSNFRSMTEDDARVIATLEGRVGAPCTAGTTYPTVARTNRNTRSYARAETVEVGRKSFMNLIGGAVIDADGNFNAGATLGLMYGNYGKRWGWYGKLLWTHASASDLETLTYGRNEYSYYYGPTYQRSYEDESSNSFMLTFGAIKTITRNFNVMAGVGFGMGYKVCSEYDYHYGTYGYTSAQTEHLKRKPAVPFELGFQWAPKSFDLLVGCTAMPTFGNSDTCWNIAPFIGVGITL